MYNMNDIVLFIGVTRHIPRLLTHQYPSRPYYRIILRNISSTNSPVTNPTVRARLYL